MIRTRLGIAMVLLVTVTTHSPDAGWLSAQSPDTFSATATAGDPATAVTITFKIDRYTTESENTTLRTLLKQGTPALRTALRDMPDIGVITAGTRRTALKYAYKPPQNNGNTITLLTSEPIAYLDPGLAREKPKEGYDFALARLDFSLPGFSGGELYPAAKISVNSSGSIVTEEYARVIRLTNLERK